MRGTATVGLAVVLAVGAPAALVGTAVLAAAGSLSGGGNGAPAASTAATSSIPPAMLALYQEAAATCPGLPWTVLAAIGTVESDNGLSTLPGVQSGTNAAGAEGPMQFEPATFAAYDEPVPPGGVTPPNPYDPTDAVFAAARFLCANGASRGVDIAGAVYAYNHSAAYVSQVLALAQSYVGSTTSAAAGTPVTAAGAVAVEWALSANRHAVRLGRREPRCGIRLLGSREGCLRHRRRGPTPCGAGPVRRHSPRGPRPAARTGGSGLLRRRPVFHRPRRPLRGYGRRLRRHGRRAAQWRGRASGGILGRRRGPIREPVLRRARLARPEQPSDPPPDR